MARRTEKRHGIGMLLALGTVGIVAVSSASQWQATLAVPGREVHIAVEHQTSMSMELHTATLTGGSLLDIGNRSEETVYVSLPMEWMRGEVRNVPLSALAAEEPTLGYVRWTFPAYAAASFRVPYPLQTIVTHNPSGVPLKMEVTRVNLATRTAEKEVILIKEGEAKLW